MGGQILNRFSRERVEDRDAAVPLDFSGMNPDSVSKDPNPATTCRVECLSEFRVQGPIGRKRFDIRPLKDEQHPCVDSSRARGRHQVKMLDATTRGGIGKQRGSSDPEIRALDLQQSAGLQRFLRRFESEIQSMTFPGNLTPPRTRAQFGKSSSRQRGSGDTIPDSGIDRDESRSCSNGDEIETSFSLGVFRRHHVANRRLGDQEFIHPPRVRHVGQEAFAGR